MTTTTHDDPEANRDLDLDPIFEPSLSAAPVQTLASVYYDATTMTALNATSAAAINRLRAYRPPAFPLWDSLPPRRRAAVLLLLYGDGHGHLRVVVTMRAASLRSFSGHAALPGGKADDEFETPFQIARREAFEEIGLPVDDDRLPSPFRIEALCMLPPSLALTHLVVRPCVAFLHADRSSSTTTTSSSSEDDESLLVEESLIPRLDSREVAALFSAPLYNFLKIHDLPPPPGQSLPPGKWYDGAWTNWKDISWRLHNFYVPVNNQRVMRPRRRSSTSSRNSTASPRAALDNALFEDQDRFEGRLKVWGMTGRLLVDAARIAYDETPEMEHNESFGDIDVITRAARDGIFQESRGHDAGEEPAKI
ncbi:NUDIX domain-containing protein [Ophiocordyceps camponoti-floridani]|uniref:NUDIX domain-containing protein n=1 Tax=Ophiocordyceps camponoti-floridani TaxID=2030778 RepID=A0A8H4VG03_9HYPO|nr:NUDIX domain-containing protein [Ophiocordyceps camponoti-floridani]